MADAAVKAKGSAPGQYLGYALQPVRLCYHLLTCDDGASVSIEHIDDVAVHGPDGHKVLEQTKSALRQNPVADWSDDLWKTFANWLDNIESGIVEAEQTQFQIYVTPTKTGKWVQRLSDTNADSDIDGAVSDLINDVNGLSRRPRSFKYLKKLFEADPNHRTALIRNFRFVSDDDDPVDPIRKTIGLFVPIAMVDVCCNYAIGAAKEAADKLIRRNAPAIIDAVQYRQGVRAFIIKNNLSKILPSFADTPTSEVIEQTLKDHPLFVQQLDIVNMAPEQMVPAISDFLQCSADKTDWADKGLIVKESLTEFDDDLKRQHQLKKIEIDDLLGGSPLETQGRVLYSRCATIKSHLEGREVPGHFVPGCYNDLANRFEIGWHPNYRFMLGGDED
ncbi:MAG: hypothetical protein E2O78_09965 [Caldithrix sp.]|nr:MAG: hypothetical protein E2O78_09965 [Caldithrix sp.]